LSRILKIQAFYLLILWNCNLFSNGLVNEQKNNSIEIIRSDNILSDLHQRIEQIKIRQKAIGQKIDSFQGRLNLLGERKLEGADNTEKPTYHPPYKPLDYDSFKSSTNVESTPLTSKNPGSPALYQKHETIPQTDPVALNDIPASVHSSNSGASEEIIDNRNSIGFYIGACFPTM